MTEPRLRELFTWLDAHRRDLIDKAGELAELAALAHRTGAHGIGNRLQAMAMAMAASIEALDRAHPHDRELDEDTIPDGILL